MVISFEFPVRTGALDHDSKIVLNMAFPEDAVIVDVDRQVVSVDRGCQDARLELPDIRERLRRALPDVTLGDPDIRVFPDHQ